ncbi:hypothetical protein ZYGR_0AS06720 [Zygosaccharomyces rouxii]|uniref:Elongin-A n=1 Tax=Zygosaccharomyces rouxii TaxID=4956 RepID=A0A1Q3AHX6_ZYGRO|nr:hypothetical protein ZYGR_0AS06720 [Zygosaccharomyces rouxii]
MKSLSELCEITLTRNYSQLEEVKNIPYRLIHNILWKVKMPQLVKLERSNVLLVFEDDEMWLNFLKQDFPTSVHDCFITKKDDIKHYYLNFINDNEPELLDTDADLIKMYFKSVLKKDLNKNKYKVPYRMLYQRYQDDVVKKQEKCTERLRLQMRQLQQEREKNQTVVVDQSFYLKNQPKRSSNRMPYKDRQHSELFRKSVKDHGSRLRHFKSGGFDIAKRHSTRVAFKGAAGDTANEARNETRQGPLKTNNVSIQPPKSPVQKRRVDPPSIFLQRKRPSHVRPSQDNIQQPSQSATQASNTNRKTGHKKKSAIFSAPDSKSPSQTQNISSKGKDSQMVYIFDKTRQQ